MISSSLRERLNVSTSTPQERVRASIALTITHEMAERLLQHDKANPAFKLSDLQDDAERAIFLADIMELLSPERRAERTIRLNTLRGHAHAIAEKDQRDVEVQARQDGRRFGTRGPVPPVPAPGRCYICHDRITPIDAYVLELSASMKASVHGSCASKHPDKYELMSSFTFRLKGGKQ
jgi:hypothetical protein